VALARKMRGDNGVRRARDLAAVRKVGPVGQPFADADALTPLTAPAKALLGLLVAKYGAPGEKVPENYAEAHETLERLGRPLFW